MGAGRFDHLIGQRGAQASENLLRAQLQALTAENQRLNNELFNRATPTLSNFTDALRTLCALANGGNKTALAQVTLTLEVIALARETVRAAQSKIALPPGAAVAVVPDEAEELISANAGGK